MDFFNLAYLTLVTAFLLAKDLVPQIEAVCIEGLTNHLENVVLIHCSVQRKGHSVIQKISEGKWLSQKKRHIKVSMQLFSANLEQALVIYSESERVGKRKERKFFLVYSISFLLCYYLPTM